DVEGSVREGKLNDDGVFIRSRYRLYRGFRIDGVHHRAAERRKLRESVPREDDVFGCQFSPLCRWTRIELHTVSKLVCVGEAVRRHFPGGGRIGGGSCYCRLRVLEGLILH